MGIYDSLMKTVELSKAMNKDSEHHFTMATVSIDEFLNQLSNIDNMTDHELKILLVKGIDMVARTVVEDMLPEVANRVFNNLRIITIIHNSLKDGSIQVSPDLRRNLNKIIYDYLVKRERDNVPVANIMISISEYLNYYFGVNELYSLCIDRELANVVAAAKFSTLDDNISIRRINRAIIDSDNPEITEQNIVDIYLAFYSSSITTLFMGVMVDVYSKDLLKSFSDTKAELYSTISNAILDILEYMPIASICQILEYYTKNKGTKKVRFKMSSLSYDYEKINKSIEILYQSDVFVM